MVGAIVTVSRIKIDPDVTSYRFRTYEVGRLGIYNIAKRAAYPSARVKLEASVTGDVDVLCLGYSGMAWK